ncbi:MAG: helix-turn-helix transcriptional regulator [Blautia wexlerae]
MNISQKILLQRKKKGISQEDLANALNVSRQAVSKWESSQSVPDMDKIVALSSYFNITTDYLLKDEIETIDGADNYSSKNVDMQMLNKELSENDFQNILYEAEKKKHTSYWLLIIAPFIMILIIFIFYYGFYR